MTCRYSEKVPYRGSVWVDPDTGAIWQDTIIQDEFPARDNFRYLFFKEEYDEIAIGTRSYMLLTRDDAKSRTKTGNEHIERVFRNYRKFEADSTITFFSADSSIKYGK